MGGKRKEQNSRGVTTGDDFYEVPVTEARTLRDSPRVGRERRCSPDL
jgi:hypothetical protein